MCRIAGIISNKFTAEERQEKTAAMCKILAHGGPDDEGFYANTEVGLAFGHRRLAIIDLSAKGHQPMADTMQKAWITFNGEIYNYLELKLELQQLGADFFSDTDTEVIIQAYIYWGDNAFAKLKGMFAFALYDTQKQLTYLVRDSAGIKPLYYYAYNGQLSFASEVKAFRDTGLSIEPDSDWAIRFLAFGHVPEPYTTLKNVWSLPKGHYLCWNHISNSFIIQTYAIKTDKITINHQRKAHQAIKDTLNKVTIRQLLADAPIGIFLSGGIDSSLLTLLAHQYKKNGLRTVSVCFDEKAYDERDYQYIILDKIKIDNHTHLIKQQDFAAALQHIMADMDMPTTDGINSWFISKYAQQSGLKAVLSGIGADELFGGYPSFRRIKYLKYLKKLPQFLLKVLSNLGFDKLKRISLLSYNHPLAEYLFLRGLFVPADIAHILNIPEKQVIDVLFASPIALNHKMNDEQKASWFETNLYMQNQLLRDTDVMSMAHGLEVRVPFLDEDFQEVVAQIDPAIRFNNRQPKKILIDSFESLLPPEIWNRPKMGFTFPLQEWMRTHHQIGDTQFYKGKAAQKFIKRFRNKQIHWSKAFALYQLQLHNPNIQPVSKKVELLTLESFSAMGGIQKMSRTMAYTLKQITDKRHWHFNTLSCYDHDKHLDNLYLPAYQFKGYNQKRTSFALKATLSGLRSDVVILSHINLAPIGWLIKLLKPKCEVWLVVHGIEVWRPLKTFQQKLLNRCDKIICVSNFTRNKIISLHQANPNKCIVLNNTLDPSLKLPVNFKKPDYLMDRYQLSGEHQVIFTLTRLASSEQYKGYEQVIQTVARLKDQFPGIRYILSGKYDQREGARIKALIEKHEVEAQVMLTGFIKETELEDHFLLADVFVLPSKKEGFGIVFIEALACGLPVICGNEDGSLDAIHNGELGKAINTDNIEELEQAIQEHLQKPLTPERRKELQSKCLEYFDLPVYAKKLEKLLTEQMY